MIRTFSHVRYVSLANVQRIRGVRLFSLVFWIDVRVSPDKCEFHTQKTEFLRQIIRDLDRPSKD